MISYQVWMIITIALMEYGSFPGYNRSMNIRKIIGYALIVAGAVVLSCMLHTCLQPENLLVIGSADGPTAIVVSD